MFYPADMRRATHVPRTSTRTSTRTPSRPGGRAAVDFLDEPILSAVAALLCIVAACAPEEVATGYADGVAVDLVVVDVDGHPVEIQTAAALVAMQAHADDDDVTLRVVSGFRTMAEQERLYACFVECTCNNCELAAAPGTSEHQSGRAVDLNTSEPGSYNWLDDHGAEHGFARTEPSEEWHWVRVSGPGASSGAPS